MPIKRKASVVVVDPEPVSRLGLLRLISTHPALSVAGEADNATLAREMASRLKPQVVVLDLALGDGWHFLRQLLRSNRHANVVVFTALEDAETVQRAFRSGVRAYITRRDPVADLMRAIVGAVDGDRHVGPRVEHLILDRMAHGSVRLGADETTALSGRERQVFGLIGAGHSARSIAEDLGVSVKTVETHQQRMKEKLGVKSGDELKRVAVLAANGSKN